MSPGGANVAGRGDSVGLRASFRRASRGRLNDKCCAETSLRWNRDSAPAPDRIMIYRKHAVVSINHANPIYINGVEQIQMVCGTLTAIPTNHHLLYGTRAPKLR